MDQVEYASVEGKGAQGQVRGQKCIELNDWLKQTKALEEKKPQVARNLHIFEMVLYK